MSYPTPLLLLPCHLLLLRLMFNIATPVVLNVNITLGNYTTIPKVSNKATNCE